MNYFIAALIGLVSGITSGLFGVGGGVVMVPAMLFFLDNAQSAADSTQPTLGRRPGSLNARPGIIARRPALGGRGRQIPPALRDRYEKASPEEREQMLKRLQQQAKRGLNEN